MAMSLKQELEISARAVAAFDQGEYSTTYEHFETIADSSSKIRFNMAVVLATLAQHEDAIVQFQAALRMDRYLAVAYFQAGVSNFMLGNFEEAQDQFDDAYLYLRGNHQIDYEQLGLKFKLFSCEVLFNRGLCAIYQGNAAGLQDLRLASLEKQTSDHSVIDQAMRNKGTGYTVFSLPAGLLYRPDEAKLRNVAVKDYLGKARLIASIDAGDLGTGFRGYEQAKANSTQSLPIARPEDDPSEVNSLLARFSFTSRAKSLAKVDRHLEQARELEFSRLDDALLRKASVSSVRGNFPPPVRSRSLFKRVRDLPPTPPRTESRASSRQSSYASSTLSERQALPVRSSPALFRSATMTPPSSLKKPTPTAHEFNSSNLPASPRSGSPTGYKGRVDARNYTTELAELRLELPQVAQAVGIGRSSSQHSGTSSISQYSASGNDEPDNDGDLIDDYYSQTSISGSSVRSRASISRVKIRVYGVEDTRVITVEPTTTLPELHERLKKKFQWTTMPKLRTKDEDNEMILLQDQEDLHICLETALLQAQEAYKDIAKLEIWVQ